MVGPSEASRLKHLWDAASEHASFRNKESAASSAEIAKDKTLYFEKLAFGSGATIAALVSFLGAHTSKLQPRWMLRSILITLVAAMTTALLRNWVYPFYIFSARLKTEFKAKQAAERHKRDYLEVAPAIGLEDGQPIDVALWFEQHEKDDALYATWIDEQSRREDRAWKWTLRLEASSLICAGLSMLLLVVLAWRNF